MKVFEVQFPTEFVRDNTNFNPSLARVGEGRYLMSCHSFRRYPPGSGLGNHPWDGGPGSRLWWGLSPAGFHGTILFEVAFDGVRLEVLRVLGELRDVVDARLYPLGPSRVFLTANARFGQREFGRDRRRFHLGRRSRDCRPDYCTGIGSALIALDQGQIEVGEVHPLCTNLAVPSDKNWSTWVYQGTMYVSYVLTPKHTVFYTLDGDTDHCLARSSDRVTVFQRIQDSYNLGLIFSLSTPALPFDDGYLGVGHVKVVTQWLDRPDSHAYVFAKTNSDLPIHPLGYWYLMFFYTFNPETLEITRISHAFLPPFSKHGVVFASGLSRLDPDTYIISYGEGDAHMKLLTITKSELQPFLFSSDIHARDFRLLRVAPLTTAGCTTKTSIGEH